MRRTIYRFLLFSLLLLLLCGCGGEPASVPTTTPAAETADPYAHMVEVESGFGSKMWVPLYEDLPVNPFTPEDFLDGEYQGKAYAALHGVDVSEHQGEIDWASVRAGGVSFAILRAGYRGYGQAGSLNADPFFPQNVSGARENGLRIGVYFFSQAVNVEEAREEAYFLLEQLRPYGPGAFSMPVYYDWEAILTEEARTDGVGGATVTDCAVAFCEVLEAAGYEAGVYVYRNLGYFTYDLRQLRAYSLWVAAAGTYPDFYYAHALWQYSFTGTVPGISGDVDLDYLFLPMDNAST